MFEAYKNEKTALNLKQVVIKVTIWIVSNAKKKVNQYRDIYNTISFIMTNSQNMVQMYCQ
jgi:hypothetical protein